MEPTEHVRCRVCDRPLDANGRGDYVDCCSRFVPGPRPRQEARGAVRWWGRLVDRVVLGTGTALGSSPAGRFVVLVLGLLLANVVLFWAARFL